MAAMTQQDSQTLARAEKSAASQITMRAKRWVLAACAVVYLVALVLPFAGGVAGWQVLGLTQASRDARTSVAEYLFVWFSFIGVGVLTSLAVALRRFAVTLPAWMVTTVSAVFSILGIWLRNQSAPETSRDIGYYLAMLAVFVAVFTLFPLILSRSEAQVKVADERAKVQQRDDVALLQQSATHQANAHEENPLLVDDRRARAAERHRKI